MTLYLIGIGLSDEKDISVRGLEIIKRCDIVYLEDYTSILQCSLKELERFYGKQICLADRRLTEEETEKIVSEAKTKEVALLVVGDPFSATTHIEFLKLSREKNVSFRAIHNASILNAVGMTGLQLYKFGKTTSLPFREDHPQLETPYVVLKENKKRGLHTLFLLDLNPEQKRFMAIAEGLEILEKIEKRKKEKIIFPKLLVVACARLGSEDYVIKAGTLEKIKQSNWGKPPYSLIIPGKLHFKEEEILKLYSM